MSRDPQASPVKCHRWYQFSLRRLLIGVAVLSTLLGLFAARWIRAREQASIVALISSNGGSVTYDHEVVRRQYGQISRVEKQSSIPAWLLNWLGRDFFHDVVMVECRSEETRSPGQLGAMIKAVPRLRNLESLTVISYRSSKVDEADLAPISRCRRLTELTLWGDGFGVDEMSYLKSLPQLESLKLVYTTLTDKGLATIGQLSSLKRLSLEGETITDRHLAHLAALDNLQVLNLDSTPITGKGVPWPPSLRIARFSFSQLTDEGLKSLARCKHLEYLDLSRTSITDDGIEHLVALTALKHLDLSGNKLSSSGIKHLKGLPRLESLDLHGTYVDGEFEWPMELIKVNLFGSCMTDLGLERLANCPKLRSVSLSSSFMSGEGEAAFWKSRPDLNTPE